MNGKINIMIKSILSFGGTLIVLWLLLVLASAIPNASIKEKMADSVFYFSDKDAFAFPEDKALNGVTDNYADAILVGVSWNMGRGNPFVAAVDTAYYDGDKFGENAGLYLAVIEDKAPNTEYTRYWHGSAAMIRVLSLFMDIEGIKLTGFVAFVILTMLTCAMLIRRKHIDLAIVLLLSLVAVQAYNIRLCMEYQPAFLVTFLMLPLYIWLERKENTKLLYLSVISGTAIAFFDFLTTETITILLPLAIVLAIRMKENRIDNTKNTLLLLVKNGVAWAVAYAGTFVAKWSLATVVTGENAFAKAFSAAALRAGSTVMEQDVDKVSIVTALLSNISTMFGGKVRVDTQGMLIALVIVGAVIASVWYLFYDKKKDKRGVLLLLCIGAVVLIRYMVLINHSYMHCFFTYRALVVPVFADLTALWFSIRIPLGKGRGR